MSKILRRCLSLVLVVMLLASLALNGSLSASADNKTGDGLAAYAMQAYNEGWVYSWGGSSPGAVDCSGLIYGYVGSGARTTEDMLNSSPESGYVSDGVPDIPGLGLWQPGHVGVYVGGGMAVDSRDEISNVCYQSVATKSWVMWFKVNGVSYGTDSSVTNDNQSEISDSSDNKSQTEPDTLSKGESGLQVQALQERLKELGYFEDNTTTYFGDVTESALIGFQNNAGLEPSGIYDETTKKALLSDNAPVKDEIYGSESDIEEDTPNADSEETINIPTDGGEELISEIDEENSEIPDDGSEVLGNSDSSLRQFGEDNEVSAEYGAFDAADTDVIYEETEFSSPQDAVYQLGDEGSDISNIQYMLILLDYYHYDITGRFDETTANAVEFFQLDNSLDATGYINDTTLSAVYDKYESEVLQSDEEYSEEESTEENSENDSELSLGMSGYKVENLQNSLVGRGYLTYGEISEFGTFDHATETAVIKAQKSFDLAESGAASDELVSLLNESLDNDGSESETHEDISQSSDNSNDISAESTDSTDDTADHSDKKSTAKTSSTVSEEAVRADSGNRIKSPQTGDPLFGIIREVKDYVNTTLVLIVIAASCVVIFFAGTVHYWNVSMEKRRQRARKATTVSVYRRGSM